ncbi:MAG: LEA type 2 family protein [Endomicrobiales bacterium]|nr:LEA type 2 family protein [Endomicrobiales bacterium]
MGIRFVNSYNFYVKSVVKSLFIVVLFSLVGCATIQKHIAVRNCEFELESVKVASISLTGFILAVELKAQNPNLFDAGANSLSLDMYVNNSKIAKAVFPKFDIKPSESTKLIGKVEIPYWAISSAAQSLVKNGKVDYRFEGFVKIETLIGSFDFPVAVYKNKEG